MPTVSGQIHINTTMKRTQKRLTQSKLTIGKVLLSNDQEAYTTLSAWIPIPVQADHLPGIMIALSNPSGRTFVRLNPDDLANIHLFFQTLINTFSEPLEKAQQISNQLKTLDHEIQLQFPDLSQYLTSTAH